VPIEEVARYFVVNGSDAALRRSGVMNIKNRSKRVQPVVHRYSHELGFIRTVKAGVCRNALDKMSKAFWAPVVGNPYGPVKEGSSNEQIVLKRQSQRAQKLLSRGRQVCQKVSRIRFGQHSVSVKESFHSM
jgi:hypothetical protein